MGRNKLRKVVRDLCSKANIARFHSNHSLRTTTCLLALGKGVPEKLIMDRTCHWDVKSPLNASQRKSGRERQVVSYVIQGCKSSLLGRSPLENVKTKVHEGKITFNICTLAVRVTSEISTVF